MQQKMMVIMLLSAICEVDAFDQPLVEMYKSRARDYLEWKNTISDE
jgi:glucose-6-phosphate isomerase